MAINKTTHALSPTLIVLNMHEKGIKTKNKNISFYKLKEIFTYL